MAAGDSYGASFSGSASSAASLSGAQSFRGGVALGPAYGAGSVITGNTPSGPISGLPSIGGLVTILAYAAAFYVGWRLYSVIKGKA